jgi:aryl-alcohol dehydrogenase-like predicted oxidoreductase
MSDDKKITSLQRFGLLGRSGLRVSPLALGAGTFGQLWGPGWSVEEDAARKIFNGFLDAGGNHIDTADMYQGGTSEEWIGKFLRERGGRDRVVLATKFANGMHPGDPNGGGNGRKHVVEACDASLRRLKTDYIDLYWMHVWDKVTPVEEVMATLDRLVTQGKVRYIGFSNVPAWYLGRAQTIAELRGWERLSALQLEYSLVTREIEREFVPAALELGLGICPWSPLANGILTGKYKKTAAGKIAGDGRIGVGGFTTGVNSDLSERNLAIVDAVTRAAKALERTPAQVALNWVTRRPGVASTIMGATKLAQVEDNVRALEFEIPAPFALELEKASALAPVYPYNFFGEEMQAGVRSGTELRDPRAGA